MLNSEQREKLIALGTALVDQGKARVVVAPNRDDAGFWFGGGNLCEGPDGALYLVGRYRNRGDSRTGLAAGERGLELAVFRSPDRGETFEKVLSFPKSALAARGREVLSIEGSALCFTADGVELFVSSEKQGLGYPRGLAEFLKPGAGVWTIDRLRAGSIQALADASVEPLLASDDPRFLHVKDPFVWQGGSGRRVLGFCTHPFGWTSSNTAKVDLDAGGSGGEPCFDFFPRGFTWDVAITRATAFLDAPPVGAFAGRRVTLVFYDGGECLRDHAPHGQAVGRPRGHSCEELGGLAFFEGCDPGGGIGRLSVTAPLFISPYGTGCSRYVDVLATADAFYATWQQSQPSGAQPLVMHVLPRSQAEAILAG